MKKFFWLGTVAAVFALGAGRLVWRAHLNLVSLDVRGMPLREVAKRLRWQTWEPVYVGQGVDGRVTLRVENQPLEVVLNIINDQVNGRWTAVYPLYTSRKSLQAARALAQGEIKAPAPGWTNWNARPSPAAGTDRAGAQDGGGGPRGPGEFGDDLASTQTTRVTLRLTNAPPTQAAAAFRQQSGARIVPEDGTRLKVTLTLENQPLESAVSVLAKNVFRKWTRFYVFESRRPDSPPASRPPLETASETLIVRDRPPQPTAEEMARAREQMAANPARQEQAINRMLSSLKNSTPQQRTERDAMRLARQRAQTAR